MKIIKHGNTTYFRHWGRWFVAIDDPQFLRPLVFGKTPDLFDAALSDLFDKEEGKNAKGKQTNAGGDELLELLDDSFIDQKPKRKTAATKKAKPSRVHK